MSLDRLKELTTLLDSQDLKDRPFDRNYDGVLITDRFGVVQYCNDRIKDLFGWRPEELVGGSFTKLVPIEHREPHKTYLEELRVCACEKVFGLHRLGYIVNVWISAAPVPALVKGENLFFIIMRKVL